MSQVSNDSDEGNENRKIMRLNIIRHRQKLLKFLESIDDTVLKPKIKLDSSDLEKINLIDNTEKEPIVNEETDVIPHKDETAVTQSKDENSEDIISVGSNEEWNGVYDKLPGDSIVDNRRRSRRLETIKQDHIYIKRKSDYVYTLPSHMISNNKRNTKKRELKKKHIKEPVTLSNLPRFKTKFGRPKFRDDSTRSLHNAKERECRGRISSLFSNLKKVCSYLDTKRRAPSKHSILLAAKKECDLLVNFEKRLVAEKEDWAESNASLRKKIRKLKYVDYSKPICID